MSDFCKYCGKNHGFRCPDVKSFEYDTLGNVTKVTFFSVSDYMVPYNTPYPHIPGPGPEPYFQPYFPDPFTLPPITSPPPLKPFDPRWPQYPIVMTSSNGDTNDTPSRPTTTSAATASYPICEDS